MARDLQIFDVYENANKKRVESFNNSINSTYSVNEHIDKLDVSYEWLDLMEDTVRYLDNILRNPNRFIVNEEEIVKVEQARRITVESIKHLSKHTNFIQEIEDNGDVKPSKILNINKDESYNTYENRVIYTLIQNMRTFLEIRKSNLVLKSHSRNVKKSEYKGAARVGTENVKLNLNLETESNVTKEVKNEAGMGVLERIDKLELRITDLMNTPVYKTLAKEHVARVIPPIKKTNLILKNVNFQYAMKLWDYLQGYIETKSAGIKENKEYNGDAIIKRKYDDVFLLCYLLVNSVSTDAEKTVELSKEEIETLTNGMIMKIVEINSDLPVEEITKIIGDKIAIVKSKREASISEVQAKFNARIQSAIGRITGFEFRWNND